MNTKQVVNKLSESNIINKKKSSIWSGITEETKIRKIGCAPC